MQPPAEIDSAALEDEEAARAGDHRCGCRRRLDRISFVKVLERIVMRVAVLVLCLLPLCEPALALRPYDSTDADVAKQGEFELELGPVGWRREGSKRIAVAPAVIGNFG